MPVTAHQIDRTIKARLSVLAMVGVCVFGTVGYMVFEGLSGLEAFYTTVMILSTIGMKNDPGRLSPAGEVFTVVLVVVGLATVLYTFGFLISEIIGNQLQVALGRRLMERQVAALKNHYILCGYGRLGRFIAEEIRESGLPLLILEPDRENFDSLGENGFLGLLGDATDDEVLEKAGVTRARGLISTVDSDAKNVFIILSARRMNPNIHLVVRAETDSTISKLKAVGANTVISPIQLGAEFIAQAALRPNVVDFLNVTTRARGERFQIEEVRVSQSSTFANRTLRDLGISREHGVMIVGVYRGDQQETVFNPSADTRIRPNDILIVLGEGAALEKFAALAGGA